MSSSPTSARAGPRPGRAARPRGGLRRREAVELFVFPGQGHAFFVTELCGEAELIRVIRRFVHGG